MKKYWFNLSLVFLFLIGASVISAQSKTAAFTGDWILDKEKTSIKNLPQKFKDYKMSVSEIENNLSVKSQLDPTPFEIEDSNKRNTNDSRVSTNSSGRVSTQTTNGVSATTSGGTVTQAPNFNGTMALYFTPQQISYNLSGEEIKVEIKNGTARIKAKPDKTGKQLSFTTIRQMQTPNGLMEIITRESWKISEDGKSLKLERSIQTPTSRDEITLMLKKVE
jgi:hypothetical protein